MDNTVKSYVQKLETCIFEVIFVIHMTQNKKYRVDGIPNVILKKLFEEMYLLITEVFNIYIKDSY